MEYKIIVAHNSTPASFQSFCTIKDFEGDVMILEELCEILNETNFRDCTFLVNDK
jgi:hypothetical protein